MDSLGKCGSIAELPFLCYWFTCVFYVALNLYGKLNQFVFLTLYCFHVTLVSFYVYIYSDLIVPPSPCLTLLFGPLLPHSSSVSMTLISVCYIVFDSSYVSKQLIFSSQFGLFCLKWWSPSQFHGSPCKYYNFILFDEIKYHCGDISCFHLII